MEVRAKTDDEGRFRLTTPRMAGVSYPGCEGSGPIAPAGRSRPWVAVGKPLVLILRKPEPRIVKIVGPDGKPVVGSYFHELLQVDRASISRGNGEVPNTLAARGRSRPDRTAQRPSTAWRPRTN